MPKKEGGVKLKTFEISQKAQKNGRRKFKVILHEIYPDSVIDESTGTGSQMNKNGITWIRKYCENELNTIKGMSLRCEFLDDERTELCGHGETDIIDGEPIFENAVVIGTFEKGYIEEIVNEEGKTITACIGIGTIDSSCYHNLCVKLDEDIEKGIYPSGSVEIIKKPDENSIQYLGGYVDKGRIPTKFSYSAYALLGVAPADHEAKLVELNETQKEDINKMNEAEIKSLIEETVKAMTDQTSVINQCKADYDQKIAEANTEVKKIVDEKEELQTKSDLIQKALDEAHAELEEKYKEISDLHDELDKLHDELAKAKAKERIEELKFAISNFSDEEKEYAKDEIKAFNDDPISSEINSVVNKIWEGIGKKAKEAAVVSEKNSFKNIEDIFSVVETKTEIDTDTNIF